ncbi:MAG: ABC transporter ATP-binding protein [Clostridia bacterium]|nr:ABC transporter ATP-binding protein [Clostridia bacterium]
MENVIEIDHLSKSFGDIHAVSDLSFKVKKGELFAFLGVNGAGKSTTISMICGQLRKDGGRIVVCGEEADKNFDGISRRIGVVFQSSALDAQLSARDNLRSRAALYGITGKEFEDRMRNLADILDFGDFLNRPLAKLSGGQKRRIDIARALLHEPEILILDEPTTGLDPQTRRLLWDVVDSLRKEKGMTVFLTTHYMEEAADADYIIILEKGKIAAEGTPLDLKNRYAGDYVTIYGADESIVGKLGLKYDKVRDAVRISVSSTAEVTKLILSHPDLFSDYEVTKGKMDDVFLAVTGRYLPGGGENENAL